MSNYFFIFFSKLLDYFFPGRGCAFLGANWHYRMLYTAAGTCSAGLYEGGRAILRVRGETGLSIVLAADSPIK
jgi:hypothetical protein